MELTDTWERRVEQETAGLACGDGGRRRESPLRWGLSVVSRVELAASCVHLCSSKCLSGLSGLCYLSVSVWGGVLSASQPWSMSSLKARAQRPCSSCNASSWVSQACLNSGAQRTRLGCRSFVSIWGYLLPGPPPPPTQRMIREHCCFPPCMGFVLFGGRSQAHKLVVVCLCSSARNCPYFRTRMPLRPPRCFWSFPVAPKPQVPMFSPAWEQLPPFPKQQQFPPGLEAMPPIPSSSALFSCSVGWNQAVLRVFQGRGPGNLKLLVGRGHGKRILKR